MRLNLVPSRLASVFICTCGVLLLGLVPALPYFLRFDLTDEKLYSLSPGSMQIIQSLTTPVEVKLYLSQSLAGLHPVLQSHGRRVEEFLREYASHTRGALRFELIDPRPDSDDEVWARKYGVRSLPGPGGESAYLGAVLIAGDREIAIPFFDPRKEDLLEFEVTEALAKLQRKQSNKLAIYSSLPIGVNGSQPRDNAGRSLDWIFLGRLKDFYEVEVYPTPPELIAPDVKVLIVMHPKELEAKSAYAIDQFLMRGGRLVLILDSFSRFALDQQSLADQKPGFEISPSSSQLSSLLNHWGVKFIENEIVADLQYSTKVEKNGQIFDNPLYLSLDQSHLSREAVITTSLKQLLLVEAGSFDVSKLDPQLRYESLIQTSDKAGLVPHIYNSLFEPEAIAPKISGERGVKQLAGMLRGKFTSAFKSPPEGASSNDAAAVRSASEATVLLIGDSDFLYEANAIEALKMGEQWVQKPRNDNITFLVNALALLSGSNELISLRSSGRVQRPFIRLKEMQEKALQLWKGQEESLSQRLSALGQEIGLLQSQLKGSDQQNPAALETQIQAVRAEELKLRAQRREIRRKLREDVEALGFRLKALNLLALPCLISLGGILIYRRRYRS